MKYLKIMSAEVYVQQLVKLNYGFTYGKYIVNSICIHRLTIFSPLFYGKAIEKENQVTKQKSNHCGIPHFMGNIITLALLAGKWKWFIYQ